MSVAFSEETRREYERLLPRYPNRQAAILPTLYLAQREFGYLSDESIRYVADLLGFPPSLIHGVATFYTMYNKKPVGKYHLQICRNLSCSLMGAEHLIEHVAKKIGVRPGETTPRPRPINAPCWSLEDTHAGLAVSPAREPRWRKTLPTAG